MQKEEAITKCMSELRDYDEWTYNHSIRVWQYSKKLGHCLGLDPDTMRYLEDAAKLHDIGKLAVPSSILDKPDKLTAVEYEIVKQHTEYGYTLLRILGFPEVVCQAVRDHHERYDGCGYGARKDFSIIAKIICVADSFDAMTNTRPYKAAKKGTEVLEDLAKNTGTQFDPEISEIAKKLLC